MAAKTSVSWSCRFGILFVAPYSDHLYYLEKNKQKNKSNKANAKIIDFFLIDWNDQTQSETLKKNENEMNEKWKIQN